MIVEDWKDLYFSYPICVTEWWLRFGRKIQGSRVGHKHTILKGSKIRTDAKGKKQSEVHAQVCYLRLTMMDIFDYVKLRETFI